MNRTFFLFSELLRRDLSTRYAGSFGGPLWALLNPLILCALYSFVFVVVIRLSPPPGFPASYAEFLLAGLLPWLGFAEAVARSTTSVVDQGHLVKKLRFPVELLVASSAAAALVLQMAGLALLGCFVAVTGRGDVRPAVLFLALAFEAVLLAGPCLLLAALDVFFRDLAQIVSPLLMIVLYLTPILYPASLVPEPLAPLLALNPVSDLVALFRAALFGGPLPSAVRLAAWAGGFLLLAAAALAFFRRSRRVFSDLL
ncbi:MAG TPA: ABC transporter permease [Thermoanaerobaculia bacterium]|nr:ABC transporter permease [Thermoanaerobaculia bacterium]